jgi:hypothetical protein
MARDPEERGMRAADDLERAIRYSMSSAEVVVALRSNPTADDLTVRTSSDRALTGKLIVPDERMLIGEAIQTGVGVAGSTDRCELELAQPLRRLGAGVLVAPIRTATQTWGAVAVVQRGALFPEDDLRLLAQLGRYTGTALDHADLVMQARERERELADRRVHAVEAQMTLTLDSIKDYAMFVLDREGRVATWHVGGSPDMGGVSADGNVLWLSGRYNREVYAISTRGGRVLARIPVGAAPHGLCVWPQPGRYSLGHTGILR